MVASEVAEITGMESSAIELKNYDKLERIILVLCVCFALLFELCYHCFIHRSEHSYRFKNKEDKRAMRSRYQRSSSLLELQTSAKRPHVSLWKELVFRIGGEFQALGFLAFVIFVLSTEGFFKLMLRVETDSEHYPTTEEEWLSTVARVHIKLFISMILYFVIISGVVLGSIRQLKKWDEMDKAAVADDSSSSDEGAILGIRHKEEFVSWRHRILHDVQNWVTDRPELYSRLLDVFYLSERSPDSQFALCHLNMEKKFHLGSYLAYNVEAGIGDSINIGIITWLFLIVVLLLEACIGKSNMSSRLYLIGLPVLLLLLLGGFLLSIHIQRHRQIQLIERGEATVHRHKDQKRTAPGLQSIAVMDAEHKAWYQRFNPELFGLRVLQIILFQVSYLGASAIMDSMPLFIQVEIGVLYLLCISTLPLVVPIFLALMSIPPYMSDGNLIYIFSALLPVK